MIKEIKACLIHWLGGVTDEQETETFLLGQNVIIDSILAHADSIYGVNADFWYKSMYQHIMQLSKLVKEQLDD